MRAHSSPQIRPYAYQLKSYRPRTKRHGKHRDIAAIKHIDEQLVRRNRTIAFEVNIHGEVLARIQEFLRLAIDGNVYGIHGHGIANSRFLLLCLHYFARGKERIGVSIGNLVRVADLRNIAS